MTATPAITGSVGVANAVGLAIRVRATVCAAMGCQWVAHATQSAQPDPSPLSAGVCQTTGAVRACAVGALCIALPGPASDAPVGQAHADGAASNMAPARSKQRSIERIKTPVTLTMAGFSGHGACPALTAIKDARALALPRAVAQI